jgi:hypothetical protein
VLARLQYGGGPAGYGCALLSEHGPSFQLLAKHVEAGQAAGGNGALSIARAYRLLASPLAAAFAPLEQASLQADHRRDHRRPNADRAESPDGQASLQPVAEEEAWGRWRRLYWSGSVAAQASVLVRGFGSGAGSVVCLHSDPALALALHGTASLGDLATARSGLGTLGAVVAVTCAFGDSGQEGGVHRGPSLRQRPATEESLVALAAETTTDGLRGRCAVVEVHFPSGGGQGCVVLVPTAALVSGSMAARLLPEAHLLVASGACARDVKRTEATLDDLSRRGAPLGEGESSVTLLDELEAAIEDEVS